MKYLLSSVCICLLLSCQNSRNNIKTEKIVRENFPKIIKLTSQVMAIESVSVAFRYNIIRDSLLLVENYSPDPYYFEIYNIKNNKKILNFGRRGKGPNELLSGKFISNAVNTKNQNEFFIQDIVGKKILQYNIDSLLLRKNVARPVETEVPDFVDNFSKFDNQNFICHNLYSIDEANFNNEVEDIFIYSKKSLKKPDASNCKFFTFNVSGSLVFSSLSENRIIVANQYSNKLDFYNTKLQYLKRIEGPDLVNVEYEKRNGNQIYFKKGKSFFGYSAGVSLGNSLYLVYEGVASYDFNDPKTLPKVEIFKFDWNGKLLSRFILDRFIYTISVSSDEKKLYGTSIDHNGKQILVKYTLF